MTKLLLVEDDARIAAFLRRGLEAEGFAVDPVASGTEALALARDNRYPLVVLDRMLPGIEGLDVCRALRRAGSDSMILVLSARDALGDRLEGLDSGADDYLTKPFAFDELLARLRALLRRGPYQASDSRLRVGDLTLDPDDHSVQRGARTITLTAKEHALLRYMMSHPGKVLSRARLLNNVWGYNFEPGTKVVDVYIRYLRRKIDEGEAWPLIHTIRGFGYRIADERPREADLDA